MPQETAKDRRAKAAQKTMTAAAASLRKRTGETTSAGHLDDTQAVPSSSRYRMASLLEALAHEVAQHRLSQWATEEALQLSQSILAEE